MVATCTIILQIFADNGDFGGILLLPACKIRYSSCKYVDMRLMSTDEYFHLLHNLSNVNIIISHVDIDKSDVNIILLHFETNFLACTGQKYARKVLELMFSI